MDKKIRLNVDYEPYYGINVSIWGVEDNEDNREKFIQKMFEVLKDDWIIKNVDIADWLDFINTLNNGLNGNELFENVVSNCLYIEELEEKAYKVGISLDCIHENKHCYSKSEEISVFGKLTPFLKSTEKFKQWFLEKLHSKDEKAYIILFDDEESKKALISKLEKNIETEKNVIEYHQKQINQANKKIDEYKKQLEDLDKVD